MKKVHLFAVALMAAMVAGPAMAQWPPPPPPFVVNPSLNPPQSATTPNMQQKQRMNAHETRAQRRAERQRLRAERRAAGQARMNACHREADRKELTGRERRRFVWRCRHN